MNTGYIRLHICAEIYKFFSCRSNLYTFAKILKCSFDGAFPTLNFKVTSNIINKWLIQEIKHNRDRICNTIKKVTKFVYSENELHLLLYSKPEINILKCESDFNNI